MEGQIHGWPGPMPTGHVGQCELAQIGRSGAPDEGGTWNGLESQTSGNEGAENLPSFRYGEMIGAGPPARHPQVASVYDQGV